MENITQKKTRKGYLVTKNGKTDPSDVALLMGKALKGWKEDHFSVFCVDNFIMYSAAEKKADAKKLFGEVYKLATKDDFGSMKGKECWFQLVK